MTLVIVNGRIWTGDSSRPWAEALAADGDTLLAVGALDEVTSAARHARPGASRVIDVGGLPVLPGFIDAHAHLFWGGRLLRSLDLGAVLAPGDFKDRLRAFAAGVSAPDWITGGNWDHEIWGGEMPHVRWLEEAAPGRAVWLMRRDGHVGVASRPALQAAGIGRGTPDPQGGAIGRDADGEPTGILADKAMDLVARAVPAPTNESDGRALAAALDLFARHGVTTVHHMGTWEEMEALARARAAGLLKVRVEAAVPLSEGDRLARHLADAPPGVRRDRWLRLGRVKGFVDGSLGARTALFREPYAGAARLTGLMVETETDLERWIRGADRAGLQAAVHAIGDRANTLLLDLFARVAAAGGPRERRFRIEHAQHLRPEDLPRFARAGIIASVQPSHLVDDGAWAEGALGLARARWSYPFRSLLDAGARLAFGSDWPVANPSPLASVEAAVTRHTRQGGHPGGWIPEERITIEEALRACTSGGAYASFREPEIGRLTPGRLADCVVLDRPILSPSAEGVGEARVLLTVVGGEIVHDDLPRPGT